MEKKIRAIYIGDVRFNKCDVFELNKKNNKFEMLNDKTFSYDKNIVFNDDNFIVFTVKDDTAKQYKKQSINQYKIPIITRSYTKVLAHNLKDALNITSQQINSRKQHLNGIDKNKMNEIKIDQLAPIQKNGEILVDDSYNEIYLCELSEKQKKNL